MIPKLSTLISSCDKFSDLWDAHVLLYKRNWQDTPCKTYLVTDIETNRKLDGIAIIAASAEMDFPMRIRYALRYIDTPYVLLTLDDYFLIHPVCEEKIEYLVEYAQKNSVDYLLLYDRRKAKQKDFQSIDTIQPIDLDKKYAVNLYPAIWNKELLAKTVKDNVSPWMYEASLTHIAKEEHAKCCFSPAGTFNILDVVRKGKVLHKARRYLLANHIDIGNRPIISRWIEIKLAIMDFISWHAPRKLFVFLKKTASRFGMKFYSEG